MNTHKEKELLETLRTAEEAGDITAMEKAVGVLSFYYLAQERYSIAATYWQKGAALLQLTSASDSRELATYLHNMAELCLIPAGMADEARSALLRAKAIYSLHFKLNDKSLLDVEQRLRELS